MKYKKYSVFIVCAIAILLSVLSIMNYYNKNVPKTSKNNALESKEQVNNSSASNTNKEEAPIQTIASIIEESPEDNLQNQFGNVSGNLAQGGFLAGDDNFIYLFLAINNELGFYRARPNLTTIFNKIGNFSLSSLNLLNNNLYYVKSQRVMVSHKTGKEENILYPFPANFLFVYNSRLYLQTLNGNKLISLNDQGKDEEVIMQLDESSFTTFLYAKGDNLYFANREFKEGKDYSVLYSYNIKSKKITKLHSDLDDFMRLMQMDGDYIYFLKSNTPQEDPRKSIKILRLNVESNKLETVIEKLPLEFTSFVVKDGILYYTTYSEVYKCFINENRTVPLYKNKDIKDLYFSSIYTLKDRLYIISSLNFSSENLYLFTMKTNGSEVVIVE